MATTSYDGKCDCGSNLYVWIEEEILIEYYSLKFGI
jgi:hypothetical protein